MRTRIAAVCAPAGLCAALLLAGCGDDGGTAEAARTTVTETQAAPSSAQTEDRPGKANCIEAGLAYAPIRSGLTGASDLEAAIQYFSSPDLETALSDEGGRAQVVLAELGVEMSLASADVLTGDEVDSGRIGTLLNEAETACLVLEVSW